MIFLHGYLSDRRSFAYQIPFFSRYFTVYAPDFTGFGEKAGKMEYPYSLDDYAREVKVYIKENGMEKPSVVAHSFGGRVAVRLASENPELFDKIVLTGAAGLKPKRTIKYCARKCAFDLLKRFVKRDKLSRFYSEDYKKLSPVMRESFKKIVGEYQDGELYKIKNRTLIVNGEKDGETPLYTAKRFKSGIDNSTLVIIKGAGHFCFVDAPEKFNAEVWAFLLS